MGVEQLIIGGRFRMKGFLAKGQQSAVFEGIDTESGKTVAIKLSKKEELSGALQREANLLNKINSKYIPRVFWSGPEYEIYWIILENIGNALQNDNISSSVWTEKLVLHLGICMLKSLKALHAQGYVHNDLKPANIVQSSSNRKKFVLIDLGLATKFWNEETSKHIRQQSVRNAIGNVALSSPNAMLLKKTSRRDDLIALSYTLAYFLRGSLPWFCVQSTQQIIHQKEIFWFNSPEEQHSSVFRRFGVYCSQLKFEQTPDYDLWIQIFKNEINLNTNFITRMKSKINTLMSSFQITRQLERTYQEDLNEKFYFTERINQALHIQAENLNNEMFDTNTNNQITFTNADQIRSFINKIGNRPLQRSFNISIGEFENIAVDLDSIEE